MAFQDVYFSGQGIVYVADRNSTGDILSYTDVGNVPSLRVSLETTTVEHKESRSGKRLIDLRLTTENNARVTMTLEKFTKKNLQILLFGLESSATSSTTITGEILNKNWNTVAVGNVYFTKYPNASALTLKAGATTLVLNTDYTVDLPTGRITILSISASGPTGTDDLTVDYTAAAYESVTMFRDAQKPRALKFVGLNTADSERAVIVDLYNVIFDPATNFDLINDEVAQFELEGSVLYDTTRATDATLGGFGRVIQ